MANTFTAFVSPISPNLTEEHMREIAGNFGKVVEVTFFTIPTNHGDARIAIIEFDTEQALNSLIKHMDKGEIDGMRIRVTLEQPKAEEIPKLTL